jgi:hypothetical protein
LFWKKEKEREREGNIKSEDVFSPLPSVLSNPAQWEKNIQSGWAIFNPRSSMATHGYAHA